jgi:hypothetical protein
VRLSLFADELRAKHVQRRQSISGGGAFVPPHRRASSVSFAGISASQLATLQSMPDLESPTRVAAPAWTQALFSPTSPPAPQPLALSIDGDDAAFKFSWGFLRVIVRLQRRFRAMRARTEATRLALMQKEQRDTAEDLRRRIQARKAAAAAAGAADGVGGALAANGGAPSVRTSFAHRRTQSASAALSFFSTPQ